MKFKIKKIISVVIALAIFAVPISSYAQFTIPQGGTGLASFATSTIPYSSGSQLRFATSSNFLYDGAKLIIDALKVTGVETGTCLTLNTNNLLATTSCGISSAFASSTYVPYTGANTNVDLGSFELTTGQVNTGIFKAPLTIFSLNDFLGSTMATISSNGNTWAGVHKSPDGTAGAPSYSFDGDSDTGLYSSGANVLNFSTGGSSKWSITSGGTLSSNGSSIISISTGSASQPGILFGSATDSGMYRLGGSSNIQFSTAGVGRLSIDSSGNVGIGTTAPTTRLNVIGDSSAIDSGFIVSSHTLTNNTNKYGGFTVPHYNNSVRADIMGFWVSAQPSITELLVGGGFGGKLSPTSIYFYTSANNTSSGSVRGRFDASGRFALGTHTPGYFFDLINTSTNQHRIGYSATQYLDTRVSSSGGVVLKAVGTTPYVQLSAGSSWLQQSQSQVSIYNSTGFLGVQGDDSGSYMGSGVFAAEEHGLYSLNGDETIAAYDWNTYQFYYFNRGLYGNDSTINSISQFNIIHSSGANQLGIGYDFDNLFQTYVETDGTVYFNSNSTSITPEFIFNNAVNVPDEAYGSGWDGNLEVPTKNALYDKIQTLSSGSVATSTVQNMATLGLADGVVPYFNSSTNSFASTTLFKVSLGSSLYTTGGNLSLSTSTALGRIHVWQATGSEFFTRNTGNGIILMNHNSGKDIGLAASQNATGAAGYTNLGNGSIGLKLLEGSGSAGAGLLQFFHDGVAGFTYKNGNVGVGTSTPTARVQVEDGDVYIASSTRGIILKSPDGTCARGTIDNSDVLTFSSVTCP